MTNKTEIIYGVHAVRHALEYSADTVIELWLQQSKKGSKQLQAIVDLAQHHTIQIQYVPKDSLEKQAGDTVHQGIVIKKKVHTGNKPKDLDSLLTKLTDKPALILVLDGIQDPHNLGACLRTANAAGVDAVVIPKDRAVQVNATVSKVASGAAEHTPVVAVTNLARSLEKMQKSGFWIIGTAGEAPESLFQTDLTGPVALVLGAEGKGLRDNTAKHCDKLVHIPMAGQVESLNVSVATGICLFEAVRQRTE